MFRCATSQGRVETVARARHRRPRSRVSDVFVQRAIREYNEEAREEYILKSVRIDGSTPLTTRFDHIRVRSNLHGLLLSQSVLSLGCIGQVQAIAEHWAQNGWEASRGCMLQCRKVCGQGHVILLFFSVWVCGF